MDKAKKRRLFLKVFDSDDGRAFLEELKVMCYYNDGILAADERLASYIQGRRSVVCDIVKCLEEKEEE
jgi:hypothetical protein